MLNIKKQIKNLYLSSILGTLSLSGAWVAILAARGFSLVEIGIAETIFHIASLMFEIPSRVLADVLGRKKMLVVAAGMRMVGNIVMIFSSNFIMVCISMAFCALYYSCSSGSDDALAYDSLKEAGEEERFEKYNSNLLILYRICGGISTLFAGLSLFLGYRLAYSADVVMGIFQLMVLKSLVEIKPSNDMIHKKKRLKRLLVECFHESIAFVKKNRKVAALMLCNCLIGAGDVLLLFFLQAKLTEKGVDNLFLGVALLFMEMGGVLGAKVILKFEKIKYHKIFIGTSIMIIGGILVEHIQFLPLVIFGGFLSSMADDALQVRTNTKIQELIPSEQRATIISLESFLFSMLMIVLSPLAGWFFSWW